MNLPNKLTVFRILLVPVFVVLFIYTSIPLNFLWAFIVFTIASLTDLLDGKIARKYNLVTTFGKLMDPLADKILVMAAMLCFVGQKTTPAWVVILILSREFLVTSLRLVAAGDGLVIAADIWGKVKTVTQMLWVIFTLLAVWTQSDQALLFPNHPVSYSAPPAPVIILLVVSELLMWAAVTFTVLSGFNYCYKNRNVFLRDI